jgi:DNA repair ATPase RecN
MADEDRLSRAEEIIANLAVIARDSNKRLDTLVELVRGHDERLNLLTELVRNHDERMDGLEEAQENSERKIAALADAQIRTEEAITRLSDKMAELVAQQAHTDQRLDALIDIVREGRAGKPPQQG